MALPRDSSASLERTPPQNIELEMCVLGGVMLEPKNAFPVVADYLTRESFYLDGHGLIFELMGELHGRGIPPDSDMVLDELRARGLLEKVGGAGVILLDAQQRRLRRPTSSITPRRSARRRTCAR